MTNLVRQREPAHRDRKLLDLCHEAPCCLLLGQPGCGNDASVPCHDDSLASGRGVGHKGDDCLAIPGCPVCHAGFTRAILGRDGYELAAAAGRRRYVQWMFRSGKVRVA